MVNLAPACGYFHVLGHAPDDGRLTFTLSAALGWFAQDSTISGDVQVHKLAACLAILFNPHPGLRRSKGEQLRLVHDADGLTLISCSIKYLNCAFLYKQGLRPGHLQRGLLGREHVFRFTLRKKFLNVALLFQRFTPVQVIQLGHKGGHIGIHNRRVDYLYRTVVVLLRTHI